MINTIETILEKRGLEYINKILNEEVIITEKLDTYRILFEKKDNKLIFYKKDNTQLNLVERTLTNVWEDAIIELSTIIGDTEISENLRFGIAYTPVERPIRIPYTKIPKYILTDVTLRKNNKVVESYDYDEITKWSSILNIARPPVIFKGKLNEEQKKTLLNYGLRKFDELKDNNFAQIVESLFEKSYSNEQIIEGIIIKSEKELIQIMSYEFDLLNEAYQKEEQSKDFYDIILMNVTNFLDKYTIPILESKDSDSMYLELISDIFNNFCEKNPIIMEGIKLEYLTPPAYGYYGDLNLLLIKNKKTIDILEKGGKIYEALFRVILSSLKKNKKENGLLTEGHVNKINSYVNIIKNLINENIEAEINNEPILLLENKHTPNKINEEESDNIVITAMNKRVHTDVDNMRVIASIQKTFEPEAIQVTKGSNKVVVYITECQPFTNSQVQNIKFMSEKWKCPVIIGSLANKNRVKGDNFVFSDSLIKAQLEAVAIEFKNIIPAYFMLGSWNLKEVFEYCRPKYEPIALITDKDKKSEFSIQLYFEDAVMGGRINVDDNFNVGDVENKDQLYAFRAIEDKFSSNFKELTPSSVWGLWDSMISEYKTWTGEIRNQFEFQENKFDNES